MIKPFLVVLIVAAVLATQPASAQDFTGGGISDRSDTRSMDSGNTVDGFQQLMLTLTETLELTVQYTGSVEQQAFLDQLNSEIMLMDISQLELMIQNLPSIEILQARALQAQQALETSITLAQDFPTIPITRNSSESGEIEFPNPQVDAIVPGTDFRPCQNIPSELGFSLITAWGIVAEVLAGMKWSCVQTIAGENAAELCSPANIATDAAKFSSLAVDFCLQEQRDAYLQAILDTETNIADYLNEYIDTTVASRATQDSVDILQGDVDDVNAKLSVVQSSLNSDFTGTENSLNNVISDLDVLTADLTSLTAIVDDIRFRSQVNQVDIEDAQLRAADAQQQATEIREDTQVMIASLSTFQSSLDDISNSIQSGLTQQTQAALSDALADPDSNIIRFKAPASVGGELEQAREVVIRAIVAFNNIGAKTTTAQSLLAQGDAAYNQQNYLAAYDLFSQAYQALTANTAPVKPGFAQ